MESARNVHREKVNERDSLVANRGEWDRYSDEYQATHGEFLTDTGFVWGPEGHTEAELRVLGPLAGKSVLEIGCGAAQCSRWVASEGGFPIGLDVSWRQLQHSQRLDDSTGLRVPCVQASGAALPFTDGSFDVAFSCFGALQFVADHQGAVREARRVLRPGGLFAFSITHPLRWVFPDDPGPGGLLAANDYWDEHAYVEADPDTEEVIYVEHHRTLEQWVRALAQEGFVISDLLEPQWPAGHDRIWGGWSQLRGAIMPGTAIFAARLPKPCP